MATTKIAPAPLTRTLSTIAREIHGDFKNSPSYYAAEPYVDELYFAHTTDLGAECGAEDYYNIVLYLVNSNLANWRGETARRVKAELRAALAHHELARHLPTD